MKRKQVINRDPDILGGTPVFTGTRVPVQTLIDYLEAGESLDHFLEGFPSVNREQAQAFLDIALDSALAENNEIKAVDMTRRIRDAHFEQLQNKSWDEQVAFYREKARRLHDKIKRNQEAKQHTAQA